MLPRHLIATALSLLIAALLLVGCKGEDKDGGEGNNASSNEQEGGHGHDHDDGAHGPHGGVMAKLAGGGGFVELKLHDDKGDLELWLALDDKVTQPIDLPLDAVVKATFTDRDGKIVELRVRNTEHNEDENGAPNIRDGKTNYFIFPGETGEPADWLKGTGFSAQVVISFERDGATLTSEPFTLTPHHH